MRGWQGWGNGSNEEIRNPKAEIRKKSERTKPEMQRRWVGSDFGFRTSFGFRPSDFGFGLKRMKILIANLGSTSLKWRLFDFSDGQEKLLHKGGFERVADYPKAIDGCLAQLKKARHIDNERDLAAVGFKTVMARGVSGCV